MRTALVHGTLLAASSVSAESAEPVRFHRLVCGAKDSGAVIPTLTYAGDTPLSIEASVIPHENAEGTVIGNQHNAGVGLCAEDGHWVFIFHDGTHYARVRSDAKIRPGVQVRLLGVCDPRAVRLYVDGVLQKDVHLLKQPRHRASEQPFIIGADPDASGKPQNEFEGDICAVRVSTVALDCLPKREQEQRSFAVPQKNDIFLMHDSAVWGAARIQDTSPKHHDIKLMGVQWKQD